MAKDSIKKVCIVVSSLGVGGAERSSAYLSQLLYDLGYDVHIVTVLDKIDYPYKGKLLNLGKMKAQNDSSFGRLNRLRVFKNYLKENKFDYIIDNRTRIGFLKEFVISKFIYNTFKTIYCVRSYKTSLYINSNSFLGRLLYQSSYKIVTVSEAILTKLKKKYQFKNLQVIYNPIDLDFEDDSVDQSLSDEFILFYGRLDDDVKNVSLLLESYSKSKLPDMNIKLKILGSGKDDSMLLKLTKDLSISDSVEFLDFKSNPYDLVKASYFTTLTSRYEGFPRVLIESLALGVPVVSVDCKSGPNEIVVNGENGLLVENHNPEALATAMNGMVEDKELYLRCKTNAKSSVNHLSKSNISKQWQAILN